MKYNSLENNIKRQLTLDRTDRIKPDHYLKWIEIKFEEINSTAPLIHKNFLKINNEQFKEYKQNDQTKQTNEILNNKSLNILSTENIDKMLLYEMERLKR